MFVPGVAAPADLRLRSFASWRSLLDLGLSRESDDKEPRLMRVKEDEEEDTGFDFWRQELSWAADELCLLDDEEEEEGAGVLAGAGFGTRIVVGFFLIRDSMSSSPSPIMDKRERREEEPFLTLLALETGAGVLAELLDDDDDESLGRSPVLLGDGSLDVALGVYFLEVNEDVGFRFSFPFGLLCCGNGCRGGGNTAMPLDENGSASSSASMSNSSGFSATNTILVNSYFLIGDTGLGDSFSTSFSFLAL